MLNNETEKVSFVTNLRAKSIEQLRDLESAKVEELLRHYDELELLIDGQKDTFYMNTFTALNAAISKDMAILTIIRNEIKNVQHTLIFDELDTIKTLLRH